MELDGWCELALPLTDRSSDSVGRPRYCFSSSGIVEKFGCGSCELCFAVRLVGWVFDVSKASHGNGSLLTELCLWVEGDTELVVVCSGKTQYQWLFVAWLILIEWFVFGEEV